MPLDNPRKILISKFGRNNSNSEIFNSKIMKQNRYSVSTEQDIYKTEKKRPVNLILKRNENIMPIYSKSKAFTVEKHKVLD